MDDGLASTCRAKQSAIMAFHTHPCTTHMTHIMAYVVVHQNTSTRTTVPPEGSSSVYEHRCTRTYLIRNTVETDKEHETIVSPKYDLTEEGCEILRSTVAEPESLKSSYT